jgi:hypothetical protein
MEETMFKILFKSIKNLNQRENLKLEANLRAILPMPMTMNPK